MIVIAINKFSSLEEGYVTYSLTENRQNYIDFIYQSLAMQSRRANEMMRGLS